ncbi:MAG: hypothetical protein CMJ78_14060 [Planctomycetaceae bacterium]|nr:hypothetical protein [Planctomycetaceae bacterium]
MIPPEFDCVPDTIVGSLNIEDLRQSERSRSADYAHMVYDPAYVAYTEKNHGGIPKRPWFKTESGQILRLGRFVNFGGPYNEPFQDDWESPGTDIRHSWDIGCLEAYEGIADGCGAFLVLFGMLYWGPHSPEEMQKMHIDYLCFDYSCFDYSDSSSRLPAVVVWDQEAAGDEAYACKGEGRDSWTELRRDRFTDRVAANFTDFMLGLCESDADLRVG